MRFSTVISILNRPHLRRLMRRLHSPQQTLAVHYRESEQVKTLPEEGHSAARRIKPEEMAFRRAHGRYTARLEQERAAMSGADATERAMTFAEERRLARASR